MKTEYNLKQIIDNEKGWLFYDTALKVWKELYSHIKGNSVLDLGCASGISMGLIKLFSLDMKIIGLEGQDSGKDAWKARNLNVVVGDIYSLPFQDNEFDTVYSSHVFEHLENPEKALMESIRVAKKRVIHIVPDGNIDEKNFGSPHLHNFNRITFKKLFKDKGLNEILYKSITDTHINSLIGAYEV